MVISGADLEFYTESWGCSYSKEEAMQGLAELDNEFKLKYEETYVKYTVIK